MDAELEKRLAKIERLALLAAKNVFTVSDLSVYLGITTGAIYNKMDELPHYKNADGHVFFKRAEIEDWQCRVKHTPIQI